MTQTAASPFDRPTADAILQSSDDVQFHVHKLFLMEASPFFATMFSLPQPQAAAPATLSADNLPVVPMTEPSSTLDALLRMCYPVPDPTLNRLELIQEVLKCKESHGLPS